MLRLFSIFLISVLLLAAAPATQPADLVGPWSNVPALPKATGRIIRVTNERELQDAAGNLKSDTTIVIGKGEYALTNTVHLHGGLKNVALRGETGKREDVVLRGRGMANKNFGNVPHGIMVSDCSDVLLADLSVGDVWYHPITLQGPAGCQRVHIYNCRLFEAGEQFLKSNPASPDGAKGGVDDSVVEYCVFEFKDTARHWYTEGVDVHGGSRWIVRNNVFRNIRAPASDKMCGGAVDFWNRSKDNIVENNLMINCEIGIRMGIMDREGYDDHSGGIVRNNFIYRAKGACAHHDVAIQVCDSPDTKVLCNTIFLEDDYPNAIETRFPAAKNVLIAGNLTNKQIRVRDKSQATLQDNITSATGKLFRQLPDLHLAPDASLKKANPLPDCTFDIDGDPRPVKSPITPGADEPVVRAPTKPSR